MRSDKTTRVVLEGVSKTYGATQVLRGIDFALEGGTVTGLVGENGAGKSTLIKILAGAIAPSSGSVFFDGEALPGSPREVIDRGISVIYQELTDIPDMSLLENLLLGDLSTRVGVKHASANRARARAGLARVGMGHLDLAAPIRTLSIAQRQLAEIARCLVRDARVLILDEPTSSLPEQDVATLLQVVETLRDEGIAILYVSHHLDELFRVADKLVVLRDGAKVTEKPTTEWTEPGLVRAMLAKDLDEAYPWRAREIRSTVLNVTNLTASGITDVSVNGRSGEIVGLVGLAGAGRTELMKAIAGASPASGEVRIDGRRMRAGSVLRAQRARVLLAPEDRKRDGLVLTASVESNIFLGNLKPVSRAGVLRKRLMTRLATDITRRYRVRLGAVRQAVGELSGGNQQKVVVARISERAPRVALFDDPTRGVDVGAKAGIYEEIFSLAESGATILLCSSDTDEVLAVSDRAYVMAGGRIVGEIARENFDRETILHLSSGGPVVKQNGTPTT